ncbi:Acyltransferase family protein [Prevotellaceae bacterium MN60]|nr:Acyltransferase family protein [Prevotellaceae bacterium MN60]
MSVSNTDSLVINWLRFPMAVLIVFMHTPFLFTVCEGVELGLLEESAVTIHAVIAQIIAQIAVPLFFLISGYLFFQNLEDWENHTYLHKLKKRTKSLVIPYLVWNLLFFIIPFVVVPIIRGDGFDMQSLQCRGYWRIFWDNNLYGATEINRANIFGMNMPKGGCPIDGPLWFIRDLILLNILAPIIYWFTRYTKLIFIFILGGLMILDVWIPIRFLSVTGVFCYSLGCWIAINRKSISDMGLSEFLSHSICVMSIILFFVSVVLLKINVSPAILGIAIRCFVVTSLVLVLRLTLKGVTNHLLKSYSLLAGSSFFVFALHNGYVMAICNTITSRFLSTNNAMTSLLGYMICALIVSCICVLIYWFIRKYIPSLLIVLSGGR